jgi:RimJ/RimL family protein N-acetyltransferase
VNERLATARLALRRLVPEDAPAMHAIFADAEAMRYWSRLPHTELAESEAWVERTIAAVAAGEADDFAVIHDGALVGRVGLWRSNEVGVIFAPSVWGKGIAREALAALIARARAKGTCTIMADIDPRNLRVARLLETLGFKKTGHAKSTYKLGEQWTDSDYLTLDLAESGVAYPHNQ